MQCRAPWTSAIKKVTYSKGCRDCTVLTHIFKISCSWVTLLVSVEWEVDIKTIEFLLSSKC